MFSLLRKYQYERLHVLCFRQVFAACRVLGHWLMPLLNKLWQSDGDQKYLYGKVAAKFLGIGRFFCVCVLRVVFVAEQSLKLIFVSLSNFVVFLRILGLNEFI